jgi:hypothetical protein
MGDWVNSGIVGNVQNVGNLAVGNNSRVEVTNIEPLMEKLEDLTRAVEDFHGSPEARNELVAAHRELTAELQGAKPDKNRVLAKLTQIASAAGTATTIVSAASALATAVSLVL